MSARAELRIRYANPAEAEAVARALEPENGPHVRALVNGTQIHARAEARDPGALLHTLDDFLACLGAAEKAVRVGREREREPF